MKEQHRTASIFAGVFAAIQGVLWSAFAIYCCAIYGCLVGFPLPFSVGRINTSYLLYLSYFKGTCRIAPGFPLVEAPSAARTYYWMLIYGVVSALWLPTSVLLIVAAVTKVRGKSGLCLYYPWIINAALIQILDLVAFIIYCIDIKQTLTVTDYEHFINNIENVSGANGITVMPAVIMALIFSRGMIFWIINLILLGVVIQAAHSISKVTPTSAFVQTGANEPRDTRDPVSARWVSNSTENNVVLAGLPRVNPTYRPPSPMFSRSIESPQSPQSPVSEVPPPPLMREPSLRRTLSASTVYDVNGRPTGETIQESPIFRRHPHRNSGKDLVNNQLPWSYINPQDLNKKKHELRTIKGVPKPPIPVPDYTIHFPPRMRGNLSRSSSSISPSSPGYRAQLDFDPRRLQKRAY